MSILSTNKNINSLHKKPADAARVRGFPVSGPLDRANHAFYQPSHMRLDPSLITDNR